MSAPERAMPAVAVAMSGPCARAIRSVLIYVLASDRRSDEAFTRARDRQAAEGALRKLTEAFGHNLIPEVIALDDEAA